MKFISNYYLYALLPPQQEETIVESHFSTSAILPAIMFLWSFLLSLLAFTRLIFIFFILIDLIFSLTHNAFQFPRWYFARYYHKRQTINSFHVAHHFNPYSRISLLLIFSNGSNPALKASTVFPPKKFVPGQVLVAPVPSSVIRFPVFRSYQ